MFQSGDTPNHGLFVGYNHNPYIANNNVYGGLYTYVIKGNTGGSFIGNTGYDSNLGAYDKASTDMLWENNVFTATPATAKGLYISYNPTYNHSTNDNIYKDITIINEGNTGYDVTAYCPTPTECSGDMINVQKYKDNIYSPANISYTHNSDYNIIWYYNVNVKYGDNVNAQDVTVKLYDNSSDTLLETQTTDASGNVKFTLLSHTITDSVASGYETYYAVATYEDVVFNIEAEDLMFNKQVNLKLEAISNIGLTDGISNTQYVTFAAFGLLAVALLASIAFLIVKMFEGGFDTSSMIAVSIMAIGVAIVIFVGYIIISAVAQGLLI